MNIFPGTSSHEVRARGLALLNLFFEESISIFYKSRGSSVVERLPEEQGVGGSIPSGTTKKTEWAINSVVRMYA